MGSMGRPWAGGGVGFRRGTHRARDGRGGSRDVRACHAALAPCCVTPAAHRVHSAVHQLDHRVARRPDRHGGFREGPAEFRRTIRRARYRRRQRYLSTVVRAGSGARAAGCCRCQHVAAQHGLVHPPAHSSSGVRVRQGGWPGGVPQWHVEEACGLAAPHDAGAGGFRSRVHPARSANDLPGRADQGDDRSPEALHSWCAPACRHLRAAHHRRLV